MKKIAGLLLVPFIAGCQKDNNSVLQGPSPGIEYRNQKTSPWPWVSIVPSDRALAFKNVNFENICQQLHYDMAFEPNYNCFKEVQLIVLDYTILPYELKEGKRSLERPGRYFMTASFYKAGNRPPCPPDIEISSTLRVNRAAREEAMLYMARDIIDEIHALYQARELTPGKKIMVNLD